MSTQNTAPQGTDPKQTALFMADSFLSLTIQNALSNYYWNHDTPASGAECAARMIGILEGEARRARTLFNVQLSDDEALAASMFGQEASNV